MKSTELASQLAEGIALRESDPERAKDLLSQALRFLEGEQRQEASIHLAIAYHWTGEYAEGLAVIDDLLGDELSDAIRCQALLAKATLQMSSPKAALLTLGDAQACCSDAGAFYHGSWHNQRARALKELKEYDEASVEYSGAASIFEEAGNPGGAAMAFNNLAGVYLKWGKLEEAHEAATQAVSSFTSLRDARLPHAQDQLAQILVALGRAEEARVILDKVLASVNGDKKELVLECLLTRAAALIQLGLPAHAFQDVENAQEISDYLGRQDLRLTVAKARKELSATFAKRSYIQLVELALEQSDGRITVAAEKIGVGHPSLIQFIKDNGLSRKPPRPRSIIRKH